MSPVDTISSSLSIFLNLGPYHLLSYGTLLGMTLYQTFVVTKVCYYVLPMSAFTTLQKKLFPVYFQSQTILLLLTATTIPPFGPMSLFEDKRDWIPLAFASTMTGLNLFVYGPRTQQTMIDRIHQGNSSLFSSTHSKWITNGHIETRDGAKYNDPTISNEMLVKNKAFSRAHAMSIHLNLLAVAATLWYGVRLASRLDAGMAE